MAAELKIVVTGYDAALAKLTTLSKGYDDLAKKAVETQKKASKTRLSIIADEVQQARSLYKTVKPTSGSGISAGGRAGPSGGMSEGGFGSSIAGGVAAGAAMGAVGIAAGALKGALDTAVDGLKSFASFLLNDVFKPQMRLEKTALQLENASGGQIKASVIMARANAAQLKWNIDANEAAATMSSLMDQTGRVDLSFDKFEDLAKLTKGYGGEAQEYASVVAAIASYDPEASADAILAMVKQMAAAGQVTNSKFTGAVQARAGGTQFTSIPFISGANMAEKVASSNALMQFAGIAGSYEQTITAQSALITDAITLTKSGVLQGKGVITKEGTVDIEKMIEAVLRKTLVKDEKGKTITKADILQNIHMSKPAQSMAGQMQKRLADTLAANGGKVDAAIRDVLKAFRSYRDAKVSDEKISEDAARIMESTAERWETAINTVKDQLMSLYPKFQLLVESITSNAPALAKALVALGDVMMDAALWIAEKVGDDMTVRKITQASDVRVLTREIELAQAAGDKGKVKELTGRRQDLLDEQDAQNKAIEDIVRSKGPLSREDREDAYEDAIDMVEDTEEKRAKSGDEWVAENIKIRKGHGLTTEEAEALAGYVGKSVKIKEKRSIMDATIDPTDVGMQLDAAMQNAGKTTTAFAGNLLTLNVTAGEVTRTFRKMSREGEKIPTGPIGGGANGGKK